MLTFPLPKKPPRTTRRIFWVGRFTPLSGTDSGDQTTRGAIHADFSPAQKAPAHHSPNFLGGPIHAAVGNRQRRSDHQAGKARVALAAVKGEKTQANSG